MKKILIVIPLIIFSNLVLLGQSDFLPGFIVKHNQDTLYGLIELRGEVRSAKACYFKENENAKVEIFSPKDLSAYRINTGKFYVSKEVELNGESYLVFLEYLLNGIYNLYYANYLGKELYFIENEEGRITELSNEPREVFIGETKFIRNSNQYIGVLKASFADYPDLTPKIEKASLSHNSLIKLTKDYHEYTCEDGDECIVYEKLVMPMKLRIGPSFGVHIMKLKMYQGEWSDDYLSDFGANYFVGFLAQLEFPRRNNFFSLQISSDYSKLYFYELTTPGGLFRDTHVHMSAITSKIAPVFNISVSKVRIGFSAGFQFNYYFEMDGNQVTESVFGSIVTTRYDDYNIDIIPFQFGYFGRIGVEYPFIKWVIYLNTDLDIIPVKTEIFINSQIFGFSLSTGILF